MQNDEATTNTGGKPMKKRIVSIILVLVLAASIIPNASAFGAGILSHVDSLNMLGLFNGTGTNDDGTPIYSLEKSPTRTEALVMLIRLMGDESKVSQAQYTHPFDDVPEWANAFIGFAYDTGLTVGIGEGKFGGSDPANALQYATFLLRALGYSEAAGDFTYAGALSKLQQIGMTDAEVYGSTQAFTRYDVAEMSYAALYLTPKGQSNTLVNTLLWMDVFTTEQLDNTHDGKLLVAADMPDIFYDDTTVFTLEDFQSLVYLAMRNGDTYFSVHIPGFTGDEIAAAYYEVLESLNPYVIYIEYTEHWNSFISVNILMRDVYMLEYYYKDPARYTKNYKIYYTDLMVIDYSDNYYHLREWVETVDGILAETIKPNMSERDKVKALHDYLVRNTVYDDMGSEILAPHMEKSVIFDGRGVCDGYANAFKVLANAAGLECKVITGFVGEGPDNGHAWNQIKIDGKWYNIDVTWDDPDRSGVILYDYFCKSDNVFSREHVADEFSNPERCLSSLD